MPQTDPSQECRAELLTWKGGCRAGEPRRRWGFFLGLQEGAASWPVAAQTRRTVSPRAVKLEPLEKVDLVVYSMHCRPHGLWLLNTWPLLGIG